MIVYYGLFCVVMLEKFRYSFCFFRFFVSLRFRQQLHTFNLFFVYFPDFSLDQFFRFTDILGVILFGCPSNAWCIAPFYVVL